MSLRQISLNGRHALNEDIPDGVAYDDELRHFRQLLLKSCSEWPAQLDAVASPLPILVPEHFDAQLEKLGDVLCRSVTSIVERWWTDEKKNFAGRMPILPHQEAILRWIDGPGKEMSGAFATKRGSWRPDFLLDEEMWNTKSVTNRSEKDSGVKICEINGRFSFNAFWITALMHEVYEEKGSRSMGLKSPVDPDKIFQAFLKQIDSSQTVHLLKGTEDGYDIHLYASYFRNRHNLNVRFIKPCDLRLIPNRNSPAGFTVCCAVNTSELFQETENFQTWRLISRDGEVLEQVNQVGLELHQREMEELSDDMLKALALVCFNDLRSMYLVHDKRMLGIVLQELDSLVHDHGVLSHEEAGILKNGIVPTVIPGSKELSEMVSLAACGFIEKSNYLLKPVGSGKGKGIVFCGDLSVQDWNESLKRLSSTHVEGNNYVVQRVIKQPKFDVCIPENNTRSAVRQQPFVGTFLMLNGEYLGIGCWRTSSERICAVNRGGTWMCSLALDSNVNSLEPISRSNIPRIPVSHPESSSNSTHVQDIHSALQKDGILLLDLQFLDPESKYLLQLVSSLCANHSHNSPLSHSSTHGVLWDVKPTPESISKPFHARSETMHDFPWHTDCSYAAEPPRFFALHVLQADRCGGGTLSVLQLSKILEQLSKETIEVLCTKEFRIEVPPEFANGIDSIVGSIFTPNTVLDSSLGQPRIRFRADILKPLTERAEKALEELNAVLAEARSGRSELCLDLDPSVIPNGTVVLMDNGRWLHARNEVKDVERHLRRIRWDASTF